jgi:hypothetical protein
MTDQKTLPNRREILTSAGWVSLAFALALLALSAHEETPSPAQRPTSVTTRMPSFNYWTRDTSHSKRTLMIPQIVLPVF